MEPSVESPVDPPKLPPVLPPRPSKKKGSWLPTVFVILLLMAGITALGVIMIFAIMNDGWPAVLRAVEKDGWEWVWKVTLIGTCGLFALLSVLVTVGGAQDIRKLLRRLREREASGESDSGD
tara:strand:- start:91 stop:456 length:366 start_codon:yes stop_codon:yes gene_type:complete